MLKVKEFLFTNVETWQSKITSSLSWILLIHILLLLLVYLQVTEPIRRFPLSILYSVRITHLFSRLWRYRVRRCRGGARLCNVISRSRTSLWPDGNNARRCVTQVRDHSSMFLDIHRSINTGIPDHIRHKCELERQKTTWFSFHARAILYAWEKLVDAIYIRCVVDTRVR